MLGTEHQAVPGTQLSPSCTWLDLGDAIAALLTSGAELGQSQAGPAPAGRILALVVTYQSENSSFCSCTHCLCRGRNTHSRATFLPSTCPTGSLLASFIPKVLPKALAPLRGEGGWGDHQPQASAGLSTAGSSVLHPIQVTDCWLCLIKHCPQSLT